MADSTDSTALPTRFRASRRVLYVDRFMTLMIWIGGSLVVTAVLGIFLFILSQILPLAGEARVRIERSIDLPPDDYRLVCIDQWTERPLLIDAAGRPMFIDLADGDAIERPESPLPDDVRVTTVTYSQRRQRLAYGLADGRFCIVDIHYEANFDGPRRRITGSLSAGDIYAIGEEGIPVVELAYADSGKRKLAAAVQGTGEARALYAVTLKQKRSLLGAGKTQVDQRFELTGMLPGAPQRILVNENADSLLVATEGGNVCYFQLNDDDDLKLVQRFRPFAGDADEDVASMDFVFGDVSVVCSNAAGEARIFSLFVPEDNSRRLFGRTAELPPLPGGASVFASSLRNKAFLLGSGRQLSLRYATTQKTRWQQELPYEPVDVAIGGKYTSMLILDKVPRLHVLSLDDPHPEAGLRTYFAKLWYEGYPRPEFAWQSTGMTDEFEPKLSMVPLLVGTFKGTFYALLFAVPIALLAALYAAEFMHPRFKAVVKPTMEIMASLPSVVLGFLAALWLAPLIYDQVPGVLLFLVAAPLVALGTGFVWSRLPRRLRQFVRPGYEFVAFTPLLVLCCVASWQLGPVIERVLFMVTDPETGLRAADFRMWWISHTGAVFEQRNALVVGFMMGFAVIPIIFTIAEDALSNVPRELVSGSYALGASRWQTAVRVVLPCAAAGVFSAIMIGLGRAVGETMIVVMATGNTPVMDMSMFSGMRTLSANIAVELPEAPHGETLYRSLFLGAFLLFLITFVVNTFAEMLRQYFRRKYRIV